MPAAPALVRNLIDFRQGQIVFLTGPNRGGKTTYLRAVGLNQVLFQAGVFVSAVDAHMTPVDAILTHFPPMEGVEPGGGRLDDEARRMREIFDHATSQSLLLLNEPLTSTAEREALLLATDVLRALRLLGARTVFVTHLHALAEQLDALNAMEPGATVASWVAEVTGDTPTYTIRLGTPTARSHASRIAEQHGITFEQLRSKIEDRTLHIED
jgi:DNA mismatch repair ATPase MutS